MSDLDEFETDLNILTDTVTGTAHQFGGLRWLRLAGGPLEEREFLNLEMLGDEDNSLKWPDLETIRANRIRNCRVAKDAEIRSDGPQCYLYRWGPGRTPRRFQFEEYETLRDSDYC